MSARVSIAGPPKPKLLLLSKALDTSRCHFSRSTRTLFTPFVFDHVPRLDVRTNDDLILSSFVLHGVTGI